MEKSNPRRELTAEEANRLAKLHAIADKLRRVKNEENRQLQTWLIIDGCEKMATESDTQEFQKLV